MRRQFPIVVLLLLATARAASADPDALWRIVHGRCAQDDAVLKTPLPCVTFDAARGYAILKDIRGASQFLLIPTARISGIEDQAVLAPKAQPYWQEAWEERNDTAAMAGRKLDATMLSLAVNSAKGRTQNQLHIHMDCIASDVRAALAAHPVPSGAAWSDMPVPLAGHPYRVRVVSSLVGQQGDPFRLAAEGGADMSNVTLLVTGADPAGTRFIILEGMADPAHGVRGSAEELQDHACAIGKEAPALSGQD